MGLPALDAFPRKQWARLVAREARALSEAGLGYPDPAGDVRLREAIAAYLAISRGVPCGTDVGAHGIFADLGHVARPQAGQFCSISSR